MLQVVVPDAVSALVKANGDFLISDFLGDHQDHDLPEGFQAYLVEQRVYELRPHFHEVDQFQVVVGGVGTLGRDPIANGIVHYTDGYTSYGPIRTDDGVDYFTLRDEPTTGINYMPEERIKRSLAGGGGDHFTTEVPLASEAGPGTSTGGRLQLLDRSPRGAAAFFSHLTGRDSLTSEVLDAVTGRGYLVVLEGIAHIDGQDLPPRSVLAFAQPSEVAALRVADTSDAGVTLAMMTFAPAG